ncbi:MAG: RnfABCDGE type electron transport complex subunit B [Holophagae bacterium]|nr:RnfABCDGE type electron transport complex subunit B [Holophagae bacterium]
MQVVIFTAMSLGGIALIAGLVLFVASKKFAVRENPLVDEVESELPGANCGGCGFAGCRAFAEALVETRDEKLQCPVASAEIMADIAARVGMSMGAGPRMIARVLCKGGNQAQREGEYAGVSGCLAVTATGLSTLVCTYGCLGYGDCVTACPFGAISVINGVAEVNEDTCTGCGMCVDACPKGLIRLTPETASVFVACMSLDAGATARRACPAACIGCKLCIKTCEFEAIDYEPFLAFINPDKCTNCGACVEKCPTKAIIRVERMAPVKTEVLP